MEKLAEALEPSKDDLFVINLCRSEGGNREVRGNPHDRSRVFLLSPGYLLNLRGLGTNLRAPGDNTSFPFSKRCREEER